MVSAGVLALVFSSVLFYGYKGWTRLKAQAAMESDANVAMRTMDWKGRAATNATWTSGTFTLNLYQTNSVVQFRRDGERLMQNTSPLITNRVNAFSCAVVTNSVGRITVQVNLRLVGSVQEGSETNEMGYSIFLRN